MARMYTDDTTNVYRQKITRKGVYDRDGWGRKAGEEYTTVTFLGPYLTRNMGGDPYIVRGDTSLKIERQKLESMDGTLTWITEQQKVVTFDDE